MKKIYLLMSLFFLISCSSQNNSGSNDTVKIPDLYLGGIMYSENDPTATVNNTLVKIGDTIDGVRIRDITRNGVIFSYDFSLEIGQASTDAVRQEISQAIKIDKKNRANRLQDKVYTETEGIETQIKERDPNKMSDVFPKKSIHSLEGMFEAYQNAQDLSRQAKKKALETRQMMEKIEQGY